MNKIVYEVPSMKMVKMKATSLICSSVTNAKSINSDVNINYGGAGNEPARGRGLDGWDD